jgi:hypothetical protein
MNIALFVARHSLAWTLLVASTSFAAAVDIRPASEEEIANALVGCWWRETPPDAGYGHELCFGPAQQISSYWHGYREAGEELGAFVVRNQKLVLRDINPAGSGSTGLVTTCDVLMRVGFGMRLENCVRRRPGQRDYALSNMSFAKVVD